MKHSLNSKTKSGIIWDLSGAFVRQVAFLVISILLARLLSPEEFGIIGISMVFVGIMEVFTDVGFTSGLIQQEKTKDIAYSSVFYINLIISFALSLAIIFLAPLIAQFYNEPRVKSILYFLSIIPVVAALGRVQAAILVKKMNFKSLTFRDLAATIIGGVLGVTAAFLDYGVYSLVIQQIATAVISTIMLWAATKWRPKLEFSKYEINKLFGYSMFVFLDDFLRQIFNRIDTIFIGKVFSPAMLGYYSRAESLKAQVQTYTTNSLRKVIFPVLSQLQNDKTKFDDTYFKAFNIVTGLTTLLIAPLYFLSQFIIMLLFGEKWEPSIVFFQILIFSALTSPQIGMMGKAVLAKGLSKLKFKIGLIQRLLKLMPILFGLIYGINEFAIVVVVASTAVFFVYAIILHEALDINFNKQVRNLILPNLVFFIVVLVDLIFEDTNNGWLLLILFMPLHLFYLRILKHESYFFIFRLVNQVYLRVKQK